MFDLGHVADGFNKGFKLMAAVSKIAVDGFHEGNRQKEEDALHVLRIWGEEVAGIAGGNILGAVLSGDPFRGSRKAAQDVIAKYAKPKP